MHGAVMKKFGLLVLCWLASTCQASDSFGSELSHATGGALLAAAVTYQFRESDHRAWIGFAVSSAGIVLSEHYQISQGAKRSSAYLDMASHMAGAALGAWWMDEYGITPVLDRRSVGFVLRRRF